MPLAISNFGVSLTHSLDLWFLKALPAPEWIATSAYTPRRVCWHGHRLVLLPIASVLFPLVSRSLAQNDLRQVRSYIQSAMRVLWLVLLPTVCWSRSTPTYRATLFPADYHGGGTFLSLQIFGFAF